MAATDAVAEALALAHRVPARTVWAVTLTHDTNRDNLAAFNIYVECLADRLYLRQVLDLPLPSISTEIYEEYVQYTPHLTLSIIEQEMQP